jgi:hypothetical protein
MTPGPMALPEPTGSDFHISTGIHKKKKKQKEKGDYY